MNNKAKVIFRGVITFLNGDIQIKHVVSISEYGKAYEDTVRVMENLWKQHKGVSNIIVTCYKEVCTEYKSNQLEDVIHES